MSAKNKIIKKCLVCREAFEARNSPNRKQKYCSKKCWSCRKPKAEQMCLHCGETFKTYAKTKRYCTVICRNEDYKTRFLGEKSHLWQGGKTHTNKIMRTNSNFRNWRVQVFSRDNYTCQACGKKSKTGERVEIHPHHLLLLSEHPEVAYDVDNGMTLCKDCHWGYHRKTLDPYYCQVIIDRYIKLKGSDDDVYLLGEGGTKTHIKDINNERKV